MTMVSNSTIQSVAREIRYHSIVTDAIQNHGTVTDDDILDAIKSLRAAGRSIPNLGSRRSLDMIHQYLIEN